MNKNDVTKLKIKINTQDNTKMKNSQQLNSKSSRSKITQKRKLSSPDMNITGKTSKNSKNGKDNGASQISLSQSMESVASCTSGVLSDQDDIPSGQRVRHTQSAFASRTEQQATTPTTAKLDLNSEEQLQSIPASTRSIYITSTSENYNVARLNPFKVAKAIDDLCGSVERVEHKKSGSLLVTTKTNEQVRKILQAKVFSEDSIPIKTTIAWASHLSYGRVYAPEFLESSLADLLNMLKPCNVVGVRKLYQDPSRSHTPLYVLTFLSRDCPDKIKTGYSSLKVDPYYQSPMRCSKCCRWDHSSLYCKSVQICNKCGSKGHKQAECSSVSTKCVNCQGEHLATSKACPAFLNAKEICRVMSLQRVSYNEARQQVKAARQRDSTTTPNYSQPSSSNSYSYSQREFPRLHQWVNGKGTYASSVKSAPSSTAGRLQSVRNEQPSLSQASTSTSCITAGQRTPKRRSHSQRTDEQGETDKYNDNLLLGCSQDVFNLSQNMSNSFAPQRSPMDSSQSIEKGSTGRSTETRNPVNFDDIKSIIITIMPILIKLFLASGLSEKVECFLELGSVFNIGKEIDGALQGIGLSSLSSQTI